MTKSQSLDHYRREAINKRILFANNLSLKSSENKTNYTTNLPKKNITELSGYVAKQLVRAHPFVAVLSGLALGTFADSILARRSVFQRLKAPSFPKLRASLSRLIRTELEHLVYSFAAGAIPGLIRTIESSSNSRKEESFNPRNLTLVSKKTA